MFEGSTILTAENLDQISPEKKSIEEARQINLLVRQNNWPEVIKTIYSDSERIDEAKKITTRNVNDFFRDGEKLVGSRYVQEAREVSRVNFDMAIDVEQGEISREAALIITKLYEKTFSSDQLYQIASFFVARKADESLEDFNIHRAKEFDEFTIDGEDSVVATNIKNEILTILEIYHGLETAATKDSKEWPLRQDGQIRRSFINRKELLNIAIAGYKDAMSSANNLEGRIREIEDGFKIPDTIKSFNELLKINELGQKIKCVSFDMFDTLVEWVSSDDERHRLMIDSGVRILQQEGIKINATELTKIRKKIWYEKYKNKQYPTREFKAGDAIAEIIDEVFRNSRITLDDTKRTQLTNDLEDAFIRVDSDTAVSTPGIKSVLKEIKNKNVKIIVTSNHPYKRESIELLLKRYGLLKYIDQVFISSETGYRKSKEDPEAKMFKHILEKTQVGADELIHIGDNNNDDFMAPKMAGVKGIRFDNPDSTHKKVQGKKFNVDDHEYKQSCIGAQIDKLNELTAEYFQRIKNDSTPEELEVYANRLYEMSRDYYAPLLIKFSEHCLDELKKNGDSLNLCTGRDALAMYFMQRKMLDTFPEEYPNDLKKRLKHIPVSRVTIRHSDESLLKKFLSRYGVDEYQTINIIDNGIEGSTQNHLSNLYPNKTFKGEYLQSIIFDDDPNKGRKKGFIYQTKGIRSFDNTGKEVWRKHYDLQGDLPGNELIHFMSADFIHIQEDLWNGIFSSPGTLIDKSGRIVPIDRVKKINFIPGNGDILPGLTESENYILMKKMAIRGILDGMKIHKRKKQLGIDPTKTHVISKMASWFTSNNKKDGIDKTIIDGLTRKRN